MLRYPVSAVLAVAVAAELGGCDRSNADVERERQLAETEESQKAAAARLAEKERMLAERDSALQKAEAERLRLKELELAKREAELDTKGQGARQSKGDLVARQITVTVQLRINMNRPDGKSWDVGGGAPDPEITMQTSRGASVKQAFSDTLTPTASFKLELAAGDSVTVTSVDKDALNASDPMGSFSVKFSGRATTHSDDMGAAKLTVSFSE